MAPGQTDSSTQVSHELIEQLSAQAIQELEQSEDLQSLEQWRLSYLGRRGSLTNLLRGLGSLPAEARASVGAFANRTKQNLEGELANRQQALETARLEGLAELERIDITLPGRPLRVGRLHPITQMVREVCDAFVGMGFGVVEGPEVESDHYNFQLLNIPPGHPARDQFSTIWIDSPNEQGEYDMLLRTHTSPMQARVMERVKPPVRVIVPGKVYRYEATDATHEWHFFQVEGLAVDEGITFADLKGTLYEFARRVFGSERKVRFRCDYFPFVEPGVDMSIDCFSCDGNGNGCRICRDTGWIEVMGAGMVHPKVLEGVGYDPQVYTGFAFGLGVERIAMLKYGINDIRLFYSNDLRFLKQF